MGRVILEQLKKRFDKVWVMPPVYNLVVLGRYLGFATYYPAAVLRGEAYRVYGWMMPVVTVVFCGMALWVWERGVRSYSSTGS
ncbi:MAG: ABC-2 family transporter protein [Bryobacteraceae bacterium]